MDARLPAMYGSDSVGGRPSIAQDKLMRTMLLQALHMHSVRSQRQLVEQIQYNLLFRWFVGLAIEDSMSDHSVFSKNRDRRIEHDAVTELFNASVAMAHRRGLRSGGHFGVDGTLNQGWASPKSMPRKDGSDDGPPPENWHGKPRSYEPHRSTSDPQSRLYRKSHAAPALPSYLCHVLSDYRHGLVVNVQASKAGGMAERDVAAQMLTDVAGSAVRVMVGADKAYDTRGFAKACRQIMVTLHVAQNTKRCGGSAIVRSWSTLPCPVAAPSPDGAGQ